MIAVESKIRSSTSQPKRVMAWFQKVMNAKTYTELIDVTDCKTLEMNLYDSALERINASSGHLALSEKVQVDILFP
jgi:hypothetical protein